MRIDNFREVVLTNFHHDERVWFFNDLVVKPHNVRVVHTRCRLKLIISNFLFLSFWCLYPLDCIYLFCLWISGSKDFSIGPPAEPLRIDQKGEVLADELKLLTF